MPYRYYTGETAIPGDGSAVPVCRVGPGGCIVNVMGATGAAYIGGPDVTTATGLPVEVSDAQVYVPGIITAQVVGEPPEPLPVLYACASRALTLYWLAGQPPP